MKLVLSLFAKIVYYLISLTDLYWILLDEMNGIAILKSSFHLIIKIKEITKWFNDFDEKSQLISFSYLIKNSSSSSYINNEFILIIFLFWII